MIKKVAITDESVVQLPPESNVIVSKQGATDISSEIIDALRTGDHTAYDRVYFHYYNPVYHFLCALTKSQELAADITQDTFVKLWEKRGQLERDKSIRSYLYSIAKNTTITYFNRQKVRDKYERSRMADNDSGDLSSDELLVAKETEILIRMMVEKMPKLRRRVFELSRYEGLSHDEIALQLNIKKSNVADHLYEATKELKKMLTMFIMLVCG